MPNSQDQKQRLIDYWTNQEDELLRKHYPAASDEELQKLLHRSIEAIKGRAYRLKLRKDARVIQKMLRERTKARWLAIKQGRL
ncbi:hypothetical protein J4475_02915 [Candidatus Woesearchaeota archaeon]|nr:hypothetical protein [Candidatus Woesearchaeota archaeon]